jgi:uncharacterized RmlC-like cupin family protein
MRTLSKKLIYTMVLSTGLMATNTLMAAEADGPPKGPVIMNVQDFKYTELKNKGMPEGLQRVALPSNPADKAGVTGIRVKAPAKYKYRQSQWSDKDIFITVLSGTLNIGFGDKVDMDKTTAVKAGGLVMIPANTHYYAWFPEETVTQNYGVVGRVVHYFNPADDAPPVPAAK